MPHKPFSNIDYLAFIFLSGGYSSLKIGYDDLDADTKNQFQKFNKDFTKKYTGDEQTNRALVFSQNLKKIEQIYKQNKGYTFGITQFTDLIQKQFEGKELYIQPCIQLKSALLLLLSLLKYLQLVDWERLVKQSWAIRNQDQCGSCWAFAAVGAIQINERIKKTTLTSTKDYSEQQVVDCCRGGSYYSIGCGDGLAAILNHYEFS